MKLLRRSVVGGALAWSSSARAQGRTPTIGLLTTGTVDYMQAAFFKGLAAMGFVEGRTLNVIVRNAQGQADRLPAMAEELVQARVDVICSQGGPLPSRAAKAATSTIPIVFAYGGDPVADGLVASFSRPGGNVTGATFMGVAYTTKRLELLRQLVPQAKTLALMLNPKTTLAEIQIRDARAAASALGIELQVVTASTGEEIDAAFAVLRRQKVPALLVGVDPTYGLEIGRAHV